MKLLKCLTFLALSLLMLSFLPAGKRKKPTLPPKDHWGHIQWIRSVPYHAIMDSAGFIKKGSVVSDTDYTYVESEIKSNMLRPKAGQPIEEWTYDEYGDQLLDAKYHANGRLYNKIIHIYFENGDIKEVMDSTLANHTTPPIVRIEQYTYKYDTSGKLLVSNKWNYYTRNRSNLSFTRMVNAYNISGKVDEILTFNADTVNPVSVIFKKYNEKGKLIESDERIREGNMPDLQPHEKKDFWYDKNEKLTDSATYRAHTGLVKNSKITYDSSGKKIETFSYGQHETLISTVVKSYFNSTGTQQEDTYDADGMLTEYSISHFDNDKHLIDKGVFRITYQRTMGNDRKYHNSPPGDTVMVHHIINDDHYNTMEDDTFANDGKTKSHKSYQYTYDSIGNWIEKIDFTDNKPVKIIEREISYFKD